MPSRKAGPRHPPAPGGTWDATGRGARRRGDKTREGRGIGTFRSRNFREGKRPRTWQTLQGPSRRDFSAAPCAVERSEQMVALHRWWTGRGLDIVGIDWMLTGFFMILAGH